jgi:hypothetical protein
MEALQSLAKFLGEQIAKLESVSVKSQLQRARNENAFLREQLRDAYSELNQRSGTCRPLQSDEVPF